MVNSARHTRQRASGRIAPYIIIITHFQKKVKTFFIIFDRCSCGVKRALLAASTRPAPTRLGVLLLPFG